MSIEQVDSIVVEMGEEQQQQNQKEDVSSTAIVRVMEQHPLMEISKSPGHLLLLKLLQREEHLFGGRIGRKEGRLDSIRGEIFHLTCFFFVFHAFFISLLFASSSSFSSKGEKNWWIPSLLSSSTSLVVIGLVQGKVGDYFRARKEVEGERGGLRGLGRCVQELRMKGACYDLWKESCFGSEGKKTKIVKCWSVEEKWRIVSWCRENSLTLLLLLFAGFVFPVSRIILLTGE